MGAEGAKEVNGHGEEEGREEDRQEEEGFEEEEVTGGLVKEEAEHGLGCAPLLFVVAPTGIEPVLPA
jgi:hypothetical protein